MLLNCGVGEDCVVSFRLQGENTSQNSKRNQSRIFICGTDDEGDAPILWPPDVKSQLNGKYPDAGKD